MHIAFLGPERSVHFHRSLATLVEQGHRVSLLELEPGACPAAGIERIPLVPVTAPRRAAAAWGAAIRRGWGFGRASRLRRTLRYAKTPLWLVSRALRLRGVLARLRPDLLHAHYLQRYGWLGWACRFHPLVVTAWGGDLLEEQDGLDAMDGLLTPRALHAADAVTCWSQELAGRVRRYSPPPTPIEIIPFGTDLSCFRPDLDGEQTRRRLKLEPGARVIFSPRASLPNFNLDVAIRALARLRARGDLGELVLVLKDASYGEAACHASLCGLADSFGVAGHLRFDGALGQREMARLYSLAEVVISLASSDGMPSTYFEAMAAGCPVVAGDIASSREAAWNGVLMRRVDPRSVDQVTAALAEILGESTLREQARRSGPAVAAAHGDIRVQMRKQTRLYQRVLDAAEASPDSPWQKSALWDRPPGLSHSEFSRRDE